MTTVSGDTAQFVKDKEKYGIVYWNKQSVFTTGIRQEVFLMKTKQTKSETKDKLLYIPVNISKVIAEVTADYAVGGGLKVWEDQKEFEEMNEKLNLNIKLRNAVKKMSYMGYGIIRVRHESTSKTVKIEDVKIDIIPVRNYYPSFNGLKVGGWIDDIQQHIIMEEVEEYEWKHKKMYTYLDVYTKEGTGRRYTKEKYKSNGNGNKQSYVNTTSMREFEKPVEYEDMGLLEYLPLFIVNNTTLDDEDETIGNDIFGASDLKDIMELLQEYNDRYSQISVEFIKHLNSSISIPSQLWRSITTNKKRDILNAKQWNTVVKSEGFTIDWTDKVYTHGAGEQPAQYLTKDIQTDKALVRLEKVIKDIAFITTIPTQFFSAKEEATQETTATSIIYGRDRFNKMIKQKQLSIKPTLQKLFAYIWYLVDNTYEIPAIEFIDPTPIDRNVDADFYIKTKDAWLVSDEEVMSKIFWRDEEKIEKEKTKIQEKEQINANIQWFTSLSDIE